MYICITSNICYCSRINDWIGHKFHNLETASPIHTWINTKWTFIWYNTYFIFNEDMKHNITEILLNVELKTTWKKNKLTKTKNVKCHANGLSKLKYI
jgi:hypothetical protein